nr:FAD:protein FMN transferase [Castellaniella sp.]
MTRTSPTRRRFLGIAAASAALLGSTPLYAALQRPDDLPSLTTWHGIALGANAQMQLLHPDPRQAEQLIQLAIGEIHRLEQIFSLYRDDSALVRLNRTGQLDRPPADLCRLLSEACALAELTGGYFDPTVQPLWDWYVRQGLHPAAAQPDTIRQALATVDYQAIDNRQDRIRLTRPGMAITLNGIAQGYITDRVTELLRANGLEHAMIDLGEARSLGRPDPSRPWRARPGGPNRYKQAIKHHRTPQPGPGHLQRLRHPDGRSWGSNPPVRSAYRQCYPPLAQRQRARKRCHHGRCAIHGL